MIPHRIIITPAPGAVFLRATLPVVEMTLGNAMRLRAELDRAIGIAAATVSDGTALLRMIGERE